MKYSARGYRQRRLGDERFDAAEQQRSEQSAPRMPAREDHQSDGDPAAKMFQLLNLRKRRYRTG